MDISTLIGNVFEVVVAVAVVLLISDVLATYYVKARKFFKKKSGKEPELTQAQALDALSTSLLKLDRAIGDLMNAETAVSNTISLAKLERKAQ